MNKKNIQIVIVALLAVTAVFFIVSSQKGSIKQELRDFAIEDTAGVDKMFLVDKENNQILLERKQGFWTVNEKYEARQDLVNIVLKTLHRIRVKEPVAKSAQETIIKNLAVKSVKVEVYQNNKLTKTIYVGGPTMDSFGTYMILENSASPFIMEIPGFRGYLSNRFTTFEIDWRSQSVFKIPANEISNVKVTNYKNPMQSFIISQNSNQIKLYGYNNKEITKVDTLEIRRYLLEFRQKSFNKFIDDVPAIYQDSIQQSLPMYEIILEKTNGKTQSIKAFNKPGWGKVDFFGEELETDPDNFFMLIDNSDFVYAQYFTFDPLFKSLDDFIKD